IFHDAVRRCPGGRSMRAPVAEASKNSLIWNCWIGAHFSLSPIPLAGPFYYADKGPPLPIWRIRKPADAMILTDTLSHYVYSPVEERYRFAIDVDGDGAPDTMGIGERAAYNSARPTVHNNGANVTLLDAHV